MPVQEDIKCFPQWVATGMYLMEIWLPRSWLSSGDYHGIRKTKVLMIRSNVLRTQDKK